MSQTEVDPSLPVAWILIFLLLTLGLAAAGVLFVGGDLVASGGFLFPVGL